MQMLSPATVVRETAVATYRIARSYEVAALRPDGTPTVSQFKSVSFPLLDAAFSAFAQGALIETPDGMVSVEDLQPGNFVDTSSGEPAQIVWIGSTSFAPQMGRDRLKLTRIMSDTFGPARPSSFVTFGPAARILQSPPAYRGVSNGAPMLTPARDFVDQVNVIEVTPPTQIRLFHLCLTRHAAINVGGIQVETFHPGIRSGRMASHAQRDFLLSIFPRISHLADFGPLAHPRAPEVEDLLT